jgi:hypothetical protein
MQILEIGSMPGATQIYVVNAIWHFNLDYLGAPISELAHTGRACAHAGQVEYLEAG